jgi:hypothetical protein
MVRVTRPVLARRGRTVEVARLGAQAAAHELADFLERNGFL